MSFKDRRNNNDQLGGIPEADQEYSLNQDGFQDQFYQ